MQHFEVDSLQDLPEGVDDWFTALPEYDIFTTGVYACGFVCSDMQPDVDLDEIARDPQTMFGRLEFPQIRHYVHTLMRCERSSYGHGSVLYTALKAGVLRALADRLARGEDLYQDD